MRKKAKKIPKVKLEGPKYLTAAQVAKRYGQTLRWVYNCTTLPRRKAGRYLVFREDELLEFEMTWQRASKSYRTFKTKKEMGISVSDNAENCWKGGEPEIPKDYLKFDIERIN